MSVYRKDDVEIEFAHEAVGETRSVQAGGMTLAFEQLKAGFSTIPLAKGLPDDACQSPHWGIVLSGRIRVTTPAGDEIAETGSAYYLAPGHNVTVEEDCEILELSPTADRQHTMEHFTKTAMALGLV